MKPRSKKGLEAEVIHWTEEISNAALNDARNALFQRPRIVRTYDIPYVAG